LHFPTAAHLITTSVDGTLCLFRTSDWAVLKTLKGHSGRVNHVDVHPTGRVALSVGKDMTLRMWDLMRGRGAASLPLGTGASDYTVRTLGYS
jgi:protein MAK11